jgi:hypothetical protein
MKQTLQRMSLAFLFTLFYIGCYAQNELSDFVQRKHETLDLSTQKAQKAPNTHVMMVPPENFVLNPGLSGFIHNGSSTTIQVLEINNVSSQKIRESLNAAYFKAQGFKLESQEIITLNNGEEAIVYLTQFTVNNENFCRLLFFTGEETTIWINVNYPAIVKTLLHKPIIASLKTVRQQAS